VRLDEVLVEIWAGEELVKCERLAGRLLEAALGVAEGVEIVRVCQGGYLAGFGEEIGYKGRQVEDCRPF
jgi:hypothetical protein